MPTERTGSTKTKIRGVYADGPGRFLVRTWFTDKKGRQHKREGIASTLAEAVALKESLKESAPRAAVVGRLRWSAFAEQWIEGLAPTLAASTRERYVNALVQLSGFFGEMFVEEIEVVDVRSWRDGLLKKNLARSTVNGLHRLLRQVMTRAVEDGLIRTNPAKTVRAVAEKRTAGRRGRSLSAAELRRFLEALDGLKRGGEISGDTARMLVVAAFTGMRRGELFALRWSDVGADEIAIERSVYRCEEKETKTDDPRRVALSEPLREALREQRAWLEEENQVGLASGLIFPSSLRHARVRRSRLKASELVWYRAASCLDQPLRLVVARAGVPEVSLHSFRRTWENLLRQAGVDEVVRRSLAGWRTTDAQAIYATSDVAERTQAVTLVANLVLGRKEGETKPTPETNTRAEVA